MTTVFILCSGRREGERGAALGKEERRRRAPGVRLLQVGPGHHHWILLNPAPSFSEIFPAQSTEEFHSAVREKLEFELHGLDRTALLGVKRLLKDAQNEKNIFDAANMREAYGEWECFVARLVD